MSENNSQRNSQSKNYVEKFGDHPIVKAKMAIIYSFLLRQLNYLSKRKDKQFASIASWASDLTDKVSDSRNKIWECIQDIGFNHPKSGSANILKCRKFTNIDGLSDCHCDWFDNINHVSAKIAQEKPMTLAEGRCFHLLDEICVRIVKVVKNFEHDSTCEFDLEVKEFLEKQLEFYKIARDEARIKVNEYETLKSQRSQNFNDDSENRRGKFNGRRRTENQPKPSQTVAAESVTVSSNEEAPRVVRLPPSKQVTSAFSYANIAGAKTAANPVAQKVVIVKNSNSNNDNFSNIINVDDNCPPVDDLNVDDCDSFVKVESSPIPLTKKEKKALKKAAQRKRKAAAKASEVSDMTSEEPDHAIELCGNNEICGNNQNSESQLDAFHPKPNLSELVEVEMMRLIDGKPTYNKVIMTRAEYAMVNKISPCI